MIKDVSVDIFAKFLWVFYNPWVSFFGLDSISWNNSLFSVYVDYTATLPEWLGILKLAHEYEFSEVKRLAIEELGSLEIPIAERIALYQTHAVDPAYLVPLYVKMCMRDEGPTDDETTTMGMKTSVIIFRARERLRFRPLAGGKPQGTVSFPQTDENDITRTIYSLLGFDFNGQISVTFTYPILPCTDTLCWFDLFLSRCLVANQLRAWLQQECEGSFCVEVQILRRSVRLPVSAIKHKTWRWFKRMEECFVVM